MIVADPIDTFSDADVLDTFRPTSTKTQSELVGWIPKSDWRTRWLTVFKTLESWATNTALTIDEEHDTPSPVVLDAAADLACWMALSTFEPPMRVLITVDGGISFERRDGTNYSVFEVDESCSIEFKHYIDSSLCSKIQIDRRRLANQAHKLLDAKYTGI